MARAEDPGLADLPTPHFLIDEARLQENLQVISTIRERSGARSVLALKCFATPAVFELMAAHMAGTTSSSVNEARLGHERFGGETHAYSVAWSRDEVREVATFADKVIFNSASQLRALAADAGGARIGVRVNPGVSNSDYDLADPARPNSRLGITSAAELREVVAEIPLSGLMFHFNCENADAGSVVASIESIAADFGDVLETMEWLSLGGGIAFTDPDFDLDAFCDALRSLAERFGVQVYLEPGEAAITGTCELVTTVLDVVHNLTDVAIVDAAVETHLPDHLIYGTSPRLVDAPAGDHRVVIAGRTCLAGDEFGTYDLASPLRVGDSVRFADTAGYTMVKTNWFNGIPMPSIAVRRLDGTVELVREFTYDDFVEHLS